MIESTTRTVGAAAMVPLTSTAAPARLAAMVTRSSTSSAASAHPHDRAGAVVVGDERVAQHGARAAVDADRAARLAAVADDAAALHQQPPVVRRQPAAATAVGVVAAQHQIAQHQLALRRRLHARALVLRAAARHRQLLERHRGAPRRRPRAPRSCGLLRRGSRPPPRRPGRRSVSDSSCTLNGYVPGSRHTTDPAAASRRMSASSAASLGPTLRVHSIGLGFFPVVGFLAAAGPQAATRNDRTTASARSLKFTSS